ncbi:uncharacterized protein P7C70_g8480, partial [Phenoliferia sp. Uapishka_3]
VGNTFGATVFSSYGAFWISFALIISPWSGVAAAYKTDIEFSRAIGFFLLGWLIFTLVVFAASLRSSFTLSLTIFWLIFAFTFLTAGAFIPTMPVLHKVGGYFGLLTAFTGWYTMAAGLLTLETSYFVVPVGDMSRRK